MRLVAFESSETPMMGEVQDDMVHPIVSVDEFYRDIGASIRGGRGAAVPINSVTQVPPVPVTSRVLCMGRNYASHIEEMAADRPPHPNLFARWASTLIVDGEQTPVPPGEIGLDWEAELAVIIGKEMLAVNEDDAMEGVFGYTCFNDISARKYQRATSQWCLGKNPDKSGPIGPVVVSADELGDPYDLSIESRYNGAVMQSSVTGLMIFSIAETIAYITQAMTLQPGDVIATGTPGGVGSRMDPPVFMGPGDVIEVEIAKIGVLTTHIV